jgi:hypothetical protein
VISTMEDGRSYAVEVNDASVLDEDLNSAVDLARQHAMLAGENGVLVTRHGPTTFTVAVSEAVPFGETRERLEA